MGAISESLHQDLRLPEFSEGYAESFQDAYVATQIKVLREQNEWTQADLAKEIGTTQTAISRIENVNYSAWNISTLKKLARAFRVRLKVSFETYGSLIHDVDAFSREALQRVPRESDPELTESVSLNALGTGYEHIRDIGARMGSDAVEAVRQYAQQGSTGLAPQEQVPEIALNTGQQLGGAPDKVVSIEIKRKEIEALSRERESRKLA